MVALALALVSDVQCWCWVSALVLFVMGVHSSSCMTVSQVTIDPLMIGGGGYLRSTQSLLEIPYLPKCALSCPMDIPASSSSFGKPGSSARSPVPIPTPTARRHGGGGGGKRGGVGGKATYRYTPTGIRLASDRCHPNRTRTRRWRQWQKGRGGR